MLQKPADSENSIICRKPRRLLTLEEKDLRPKWLTELQLKSWEPEVLLSGIVLYGMFKMPGLLDDFQYYFAVNLDDSSNSAENFVSLMKVAVYWLTGGLIAHLISRGIWVGMVGLSFTFPKGIAHEKLKLTEKYKRYIDRIPPTEKIILKLESFSSALFSVSFMMFMMMIGSYFYLLITIIIPVVSIIYIDKDIFDQEWASYILAGYIILVVSFGFIGFIDFVTLGFFKRFKRISKIYWPIYRFIGALTLARFYRPIYYILISNIKGWKIAAALAAFVIISFQWVNAMSGVGYPGEGFSQLTFWSDSKGPNAYTGYYDDQVDEIKSVEASIQSDIIRGNTVRLFIVLRAFREDSIKANCNLDSLFEVEGLGRANARLQCLSEFYKVSIDDSVFSDLPLRFHYKSKTKQRGILTYLDVSYLESGLHELKIDLPDSMYRRNRVAHIPFYREETSLPYLIPNTSTPAESESESYMELKLLLPK